MTEAITIEHIERAIAFTADVMQRHPDLSHRLLPHLKRLAAARDDLLAGGDPAKYEGEAT
jgi:hypothetical protein